MENERVSLPKIALILALCILYRLWVLKNTNLDGRAGSAVDFCCLAETYGGHYSMRLRGASVLILAGDVLPVPPSGSGEEWYDREVKRLDRWLGSSGVGRKFKHKVVVWGDHDVLQGQPVPRLHNATVLTDSTVEIEGLKVYGTSWQPQNEEGAFYLPRGSPEIRAKRDMIPADIDVLVAHSPPLGMGDRKQPHRNYNPSLYLEDSVYENSTYPLQVDPTTGDGLLYLKVSEAQPRLVVVGQHSEGYGVTRSTQSRTVVLNPSISNQKSASRQPLFWSLIGPNTFPRNKGIEVPFVIE